MRCEEHFPSQPRHPSSSREPSLAGEGAPARWGLRILVVDDDPRCLASLEEALAHEGHAIYTASSGLAALDFARRLRAALQALDLSILDFHMPDLTGVETFRRLQSETPCLEGIFVSGSPSPVVEDEVRLAGGRAFFPKPLDVLRLRSAVRELAQRWSQRPGREGT